MMRRLAGSISSATSGSASNASAPRSFVAAFGLEGRWFILGQWRLSLGRFPGRREWPPPRFASVVERLARCRTVAHPLLKRAAMRIQIPFLGLFLLVACGGADANISAAEGDGQSAS